MHSVRSSRSSASSTRSCSARPEIYTYYFERQGVIQNALYDEIGAIKLLAEATELLAARYEPLRARRTELLGILRAQACALLSCGLSVDVRLLSRSSLGALTLLDALESGVAADGSRGVRWLAAEAVRTISAARSTRAVRSPPSCRSSRRSHSA